VAGFLAPLQAVVSVKGMRATVLGAGGAARAVGEALTAAGAALTYCARRREQSQEIAQMTAASVGSWPPEAGSWDLLVNATPLGMAPQTEASPLPDGPFTGELVYDLVYNPAETRLLRDARAAGCRTIGGLDMLIAQAQRQFEFWTSTRAAERVLRDAAMKALPGVHHEANDIR
jgi:shikimate 5-dehydrogenase